jgi:hypothetical protein
MQWLISYRSQNHVLTKSGRFVDEPTDNMWLSNEDPVFFAAKMAVQLRALGQWGEKALPDNEDECYATEILCIYSVIEVPDEMLSDEQHSALRPWLPSDFPSTRPG